MSKLTNILSKENMNFFIFFQFINFDMYIGCSEEWSYWDGSFEYPYKYYSWEIRKSIFNYTLLSIAWNIFLPLINALHELNFTCQEIIDYALRKLSQKHL